MTNGDHEGRIFYPVLTQIKEYVSCSPLKPQFYWKSMKNASRKHEYAEMRHGDVILTLQCRQGSTYAGFVFIFPTGWYGYMYVR